MPASNSGLRSVGNSHVSKSNDSNFYTEEEIFELGDKYEEYCLNCFGNLPNSFSDWFNKNKKK